MAVFITGAGVPPVLIKAVEITASNISDYFRVTNNSYYFAGNGSVFTSNNKGRDSSTAKTVLTALFDMEISFDYSYSSESNYDKFSLYIGSGYLENGASGATTKKSYSGTITGGTTISFQYTKDGSQHTNDDQCTFSNMVITGKFK